MEQPKKCIDCPMWAGTECDDCVDGRWIGAVSEYASTCDCCCELTMHEEMKMDTETQLGYCPRCVKDNHSIQHMKC